MKTQLEQLIVMINQIVDNNSYGNTPEQTADATAVHLKKFWARSMKHQIIEYLEQDGSELQPAAKLAVQQLAG
ncbi:formate dehydrogenase subunit delta [Oceanospirillum beijerinckii]|uniref:formate dehydrogenase subunit delta n=1 Tax=Oceanospirillum beijerinckii TaxID=64976 RepID=UPI000405B8E6|nr:formate dehydrogenase subunit delta [Oceanospirillum beijerinckii]